MAGRGKAIISWSSGKDAAWALHRVRQQDELEVVAALTTVTETFGRVSMHGVRQEILEAQVRAAGLPLVRVDIPSPCSNEIYQREMGAVMDRVRADGIDTVIFGDLFLRDVREYREANLERVGMRGAFPLWGEDTAALAREMVAGGLGATIACVDPRRLDRRFAGRDFDAALLAELPPDVDPCGENGEMHTCVWDGPMFETPLALVRGEVVEREGFVFADLALT